MPQGVQRNNREPEQRVGFVVCGNGELYWRASGMKSFQLVDLQPLRTREKTKSHDGKTGLDGRLHRVTKAGRSLRQSTPLLMVLQEIYTYSGLLTYKRNKFSIDGEFCQQTAKSDQNDSRLFLFAVYSSLRSSSQFFSNHFSNVSRRQKSKSWLPFSQSQWLRLVIKGSH